MIIRLHPDADPAAVSGRLAALGLWVDRYDGGDGLPLFAVHPCSTEATCEEIAAIDGVAAVLSRSNGTPRLDALPPVLDVAGVTFGAGSGRSHGRPVQRRVRGADPRDRRRRWRRIGVRFLRGGAFKPRTSPYAFQGHGEPALGWLRRAADATGMQRRHRGAVGGRRAELVAEHADLLQVGSRNMQNYALLKAVGRDRAGRCCSSAAWRRRSTSGCSRASTCSRRRRARRDLLRARHPQLRRAHAQPARPRRGRAARARPPAPR